MDGLPKPERTELNGPYLDGLEQGHLRYQKCDGCGHAWLPARSECPFCLHANWRWRTASGKAKLVSWVIYRIAYHDYFAQRLPYNVAIAELAEGPRLITNIVGNEGLYIGQPLYLKIEREDGLAVARFTPATEGMDQPKEV